MKLSIVVFIPVAVLLFAIFPLTDTDVWWHMACARDWVTTWTPVRSPVVNVHEYFQQFVYFVYNVGGAPLLVAVKAFLWAWVFVLFLNPLKYENTHGERVTAFVFNVCLSIVLCFIFRYQLEIRPVLFSLLFLGVLWNVLPNFFQEKERSVSKIMGMVLLLAMQWVWCKFQGLYVLGPIFMSLWLLASRRRSFDRLLFVVLAWLMPFLHYEGLSLFVYPFGLLDRLMGFTKSAVVFASEIAENRSPFSLIASRENTFVSGLMIFVAFSSLAIAIRELLCKRNMARNIWLVLMAILSLFAERNFILLFPAFLSALNFPVVKYFEKKWTLGIACFVLFAVFGFWSKSLLVYDKSMISFQRVPVSAAEWMSSHPHGGRLFNDDRAGGYLAFMNPSDSIYMDGRFILKTSDFFERYLSYADNPAAFMFDADSLKIGRVVLPCRYYARWDKLLLALDESKNWNLSYVDKFYAVYDRVNVQY